MKLNTIKLNENQTSVENSDIVLLKPNGIYSVSVNILVNSLQDNSAYFAVILLDEDGNEIDRILSWLTNTSSEIAEQRIIFTTNDKINRAIFCYRFNTETPRKSKIDAMCSPLSDIKLEQHNSDVTNWENYFHMSKDNVFLLNPIQEKRLEKNLVWIFASPRSGTTWLALQLLENKNNIPWDSPYIGFHLRPFEGWNVYNQFITTQEKRNEYFFSDAHKEVWTEALKKFILTRAYHQVFSLEKLVIIKEPNGSFAADQIMESLPNSKMIFLIRDGRDVVDSILDAHTKNSWIKEMGLETNFQPLIDENQRLDMIRNYSFSWTKFIDRISKAYDHHSPLLRYKLKYEDLVSNTLEELSKIYKFLGIKTDDKTLENLIEKYDFKNIPNSKKGSGKFYRLAKPGSWQENFTGKEQEVMISIMKDSLQKLDYIV